MATLVVVPSNPVPKRPASFSVAPTQGGSVVQLSVSSAPPDSAHRKQIDSAGGVPVSLFLGVATTKLTFDRSGRYVFELQEYERHPQTGALTPVGTPTTEVVHVLSRVETPIVPVGSGPTDPIRRHSVTLVLFVADDTVVATNEPTHGANSPALVQPTTDIAKWAAEDATIRSAVAACITSGSDIVTKVQALASAWDTRILNATPATPPTVNAGAFRLVDDLGAKIVE